MKYNLAVFRKLFKLKYYRLFLLFFLFFTMVIIVDYLSFPSENTINDIILGVYNKNFNFLHILWFAYQISTYILIFHTFLNYEIDNSYEFTFLRCKKSQLLRKKNIFLIIFILISRSIIYLIVFTIFYKFSVFSIKFFIVNVLYYIFLLFLVNDVVLVSFNK